MTESNIRPARMREISKFRSRNEDSNSGIDIQRRKSNKRNQMKNIRKGTDSIIIGKRREEERIKKQRQEDRMTKGNFQLETEESGTYLLRPLISLTI